VLARSGAGLIVLVTDGEENCGGDPCALGRRLAALAPRLKIHVVGYRLRIAEGSPLACLAEATGGRYVEVGDTESLGDALDRSLGCAPVALRTWAIHIATALDAAGTAGR
jgi:Ca-activated chloride channel family protein